MAGESAARDARMPLNAGARGAVRWYAVHAGQGRERALAGRLSAQLSPDACSSVFAPEWEALVKRRGAWRVERRAVFPGYAIVASADPAALLRESASLPFAPEWAGSLAAGGLACVDPAVQRWLEGALDADRVLRASEGEIRDGRLAVSRGPLRGSERLVRRIDRHRREARVAPCEGVSLCAALEVRAKS